MLHSMVLAVHPAGSALFNDAAGACLEAVDLWMLDAECHTYGGGTIYIVLSVR